MYVSNFYLHSILSEDHCSVLNFFSIGFLQAYLHDALFEMNRRLRRRMVTRGEVSLDVEDNLGPYDWPQIGELTADMLKYSVHFPLTPCVSFG